MWVPTEPKLHKLFKNMYEKLWMSYCVNCIILVYIDIQYTLGVNHKRIRRCSKLLTLESWSFTREVSKNTFTRNQIFANFRFIVNVLRSLSSLVLTDNYEHRVTPKRVVNVIDLFRAVGNRTYDKRDQMSLITQSITPHWSNITAYIELAV